MKRRVLLTLIVLLTSSVPLIWWIASRIKTRFIDGTLVLHSDRSGYDYLLHLPNGYSKTNPKPPLIVYLHGAGELGKNVRNLTRCDLWYFTSNTIPKESFPFIVASPQCEAHGWDPIRIRDFVLDLTSDSAEYPVDSSRVYLTGFSMGGFGTWRAAAVSPDLFAAIAPVAGGGRKNDALALKDTPIWCFHGDYDEAVPYRYSVEMVEAVRQTGNEEVEFTTIPGANHGIAGEVYSNPNLYEWFLNLTQNERLSNGLE